MKIDHLMENIQALEIDTIVGVPDSTLKVFCDYLKNDGKKIFKHYTTANEGSAIGLATGAYLATARPVCIYMQNSGIGNTVNPITSIMNRAVYDIPALLVIGWRGEPGKKDEPQHRFMGEITTSLLNVLEIEAAVIDSETTKEELQKIMQEAKEALKNNKQYALIVKKDTFEPISAPKSSNPYTLGREEAITICLKHIGKAAVIVSTTGKISREVYEDCDALFNQHQQAFLTVGGMGHASMIATAFAFKQPDKQVYCFDGDGAALMHMGNMAFIGQESPKNLIHLCFNNNAHESVGGMPTGATALSFSETAKVCGYKHSVCVATEKELIEALETAAPKKGPTFIEIKVAMEARSNLGRPKETAVENKINFMKYHEVIK